MEFSTKNRENKDKIHSNFFATAFCAAFLLIVSLGAFGQSITITEITDVNAYEVLIGGTTTDYADGTLLTAYYGTTSVESSFSVGNSGEVYGGSFQINVTALQPGTNYYFQVRDDAGGITSNVYEYQTTGTGTGTSTGGNVSWVTIGSDDSFVGELPVNGEYNYSLSQQIYTNAEIDRTGTITKIALYNGNLQMTRTINLYMLSTYKQNFSDLDDWESVSSSDLVFSGEVTFLVSQWTEIELNTPFEYDGTGNIIVVVDDNTGNYESAMNFSAFEATGQSIYVSSDYTDYDATDLSAVSASSIGSVKNQIKFGFMDSSSQPSGDSVNWITIGAGNSTNQNLPVNSYYDYSLSQQIYTYAEIGHAGTIESVAFYNTSYETTRTIDLYMYNTDRQTFTSTIDWEFVDPGDLVFSGEVTFLSGEWTEITLNTPFEYDGLHNIIIVADDNTVIEATSLSFRVFSATSQAIYYSDYSTDIDPTYLNGTTALDVANVKSQIKFGFTATNPTFSYVDLGLTSGTLWATMNVGAERPEDFGTYFAWGETSTKTIYDWESYTYAAGESDAAPGFTKYCNDASLGNNGFTDELTVLQAGDDAATANLGSNWRMPTYDEILELTSECQYSYTTQNGVYGIIVTGPNNHTIFIPAAGGRQFENEVWEEGSGNYWASSLDTDNPADAQGFYFESNGFGAISIMRRYGLPIRPVYVPSNTANNQNGNVIFQCDFEDDTEIANWTLNTGGQTNYWEIGVPSMTNAEKSLYITNGNGNEYTNTSTSYAYAYREVEITEAGNYQFEFDWMANGESNYDNLRAFLIPTTASPNLTDGESNGMTGSNNDAPTDWIDLYSESGIMAGQSDWQHNTKSLSIDVTGTYYLVFFWKNDSSDGNNPPAAVDNIVVSREQQTNANTFTDNRDGKTYSYVTIGNQTWMAENLRYEGNIPLGSSTSTTEAYRYNPNDDADNVATYGYLYNWTAAMNGESSSASTPSGVQGICPEGWHLPSIDEWLELADALDGDTDKGSQLAGHSDLWTAQALTNSTYFGASGFDALPAGYYGGAYQGIGRNTYFWCATESALNNSSAFYQGISYDYTTLSNSGGQAYSGKDYAYSVRCVKDAVNTASYETGTFTDTRDGRTYDFVIIGDQTWMAENLRYDNSGSMTVAQGSEQSDTDPYLYYPNGDSQNLETYGYLYNWPAAMNGAESSDANPSGVQGICPLGWHLPSNAEWTQLVETLGDEANAGAMLAGNASMWTAGTLTASEYFGTSSFNALPSGYYYPGDYGGFGSSTSFWSTTEDIESNTRVYLRDVDNSGTSLSRSRGSKTYGFSVRCIKDASNTANNTTNSDDIIYQSDFENTGEWSEWTLNNSGQTNYWTIGLGSSDVSTTETNCLYITNDGSSYNYNSGAESAVYAYKEIELSSTSNYHILFDWKCIGEESWDYLRAFIIPASENPNLSAGNVIGDGYEDANTTPDGWIDLYDGQMSSSDNQWRNAESTVALSAGNYYLVFYWRNDESAGSNPPAAVDNIFIYKLMPISVTTNVSDRTSTSVTLNGTITFAGEPENIAAGFKWGISETSLLDNITTQSTGATFSEQLTGLTPQTTYYYQAYAVYDGDTAFSQIAEFRTALDESSAGGANNPLPIGDMNDWQDFSNALQNPSAVTYKGVMLADYGLDMYFSLESDLSFPEAGVAFSIDNFKGNLNGNYNTITVQPYPTFTGLFANFSDGHIDNLNLRLNSSGTLEGAGDFGMLCQTSYQAYISNCTVSGTSSADELLSSDDGHLVGGLVGNASQTTISGCTNNLKITSEGAWVGGIAGRIDGTIMYCTNNAELRGDYVGGIMADGTATITNCLNTGQINCSGSIAGGISGKGGNISICMNIGEINATSYSSAGGIVGSAESTTTVTNCANYGVFPTFSSPMGGIAGNGSGTYSHNVSAPLCRSTQQAIYSLNEIYATVATEESEYNSASETDDFFDEQVGDIKVDSLRLRYAERGTPKTTAEIVGSQLSGSLSSQYWDFTDDLYPKPQYINETSQTIVARIPIYLGPHQSVFGVWENFSLPTSVDGHQITWASNDNAISISDGIATVTRPASGEDDIDVQITADYDGYTKTFVVRVIAPKQIPVYTGDASQDSVFIYLSGEFDNDTEGITYAYDYGFQYSTTSADLSEGVTSVQSTNLNHVFYDGRSFTYPLEDIPNGTMVYYRAYATTADGTEYGDILSYKALGAPEVVAKYPMWRTDNSATILFDITLNEEEDFNELENAFHYGTERNNLSLSSYIYYDEDNDNYSVDLHDLAAETKYYYVAEVTNDYGTTRSDTLEFLTYGTMTDSSDYTHYYTIQIGDQTWMAQNLKYAGDGVSLGTTTSETDPYYYYVNGDESNSDEYGYLYNWAAAMKGASSSTDNPSGVQGICPNGWHLPSNAEWTQLATTLGGTENAGAMLSGQPAGEDQYWQTGTLTESVYFGKSGFNALPAGDYRSTYSGYGSYAYFWTATEQSSSIVYGRSIGITSTSLLSNSSPQKYFGYAVRCVKNLDIIVATNNATNVTTTSAILNGSISNAASSGITARGFMFGTESTNLTQDLQSTDNTTDFTYTLSDLTAATTYYFKAYATINGETLYGDVKAFMIPSGVYNNYGYVDLGLPSGTLWAATNVGASTPEGYGDYYAWGETEPKSEYTWSTYQHATGTADDNVRFTKYCTDAAYGENGFVDNLTTLELEDDVAATNWGTGWRMPMHDEISELVDNCTWVWDEPNGIGGYRVTGRNGNSIFLPASGLYHESTLISDGTVAYYWSNTLGQEPIESSTIAMFTNNYHVQGIYRYFGHSVRAIFQKSPTVMTNSATNITTTTATLQGKIASSGISDVTARGFIYGSDSENLTDSIASTDNTDEFTASISNLESGRRYYFKAFAANNDGISYGTLRSFRTLGPPNVTMYYPVWRDTTSVSLKASVEAIGEINTNKFYIGTERSSLTEANEEVFFSNSDSTITINVYGLLPKTLYWAVAESGDEYGSSRGDTISFYTYGHFKDVRDNTDYKTIKVGDQTWMAENLRYAGDLSIGNDTSSTVAYRYYPNGDESNVETYGYLYNWKAAMNGGSSSDANPSGVQGICPDGWHLPSNSEWTQLETALGSSETGSKLAGSASTWICNYVSCDMLNDKSFGYSGFNAVPSGVYYQNYYVFGQEVAFWSATQFNETNIYTRYLYTNRTELATSDNETVNGYNVRCVKVSTIYAYDTVNYCGEEFTFGTQTLSANGDYEETFHLGTDKDSIVYLHLTMYPALTATINEFSNGCYGANNGYVEVTAGGGAGTYTYNWNTPEAQTTARVNNLGAGEYSVTVTDAARCTATVSQTLTAPAELTASINGNNPNCFGDGTTLTADVNGGSPDYTYVWSNNETTESIVVTPTATTTYTITVTDANNCTATASKNVVVNSQLTVSISGDTQVQCFGDNTATLTASASGGSMAMGYTYTWTGNATGQTLTNVGAGDYSVTVTDGNNCTASASTTITGPNAALSVSISATNNTLTCSNSSATLTATVTGGTEDYTYTWSNSVTNNTTEVTAPGTYMVEVSDANSCTAEATQTITQDITAPTVTIDNTETELNCNRTSIALTATGNGASYVWSNGETNAATTVTTPDTYTVTATGSNGCTNETSIAITKVENPTVEVTAGEILCNGATTTFTANVSNGRAPYTFRWQDNSTNQTLTAQAGTYNVTITDSNGCTATASTTVNVNDQIVPELTGTWPSNITGQNNCFENRDITQLLSDDEVEELYEDCSGLTVSHTDANTSTDNCGWTITRTYTIQDPYGNTVEPNPTISVSGSDQTAPILSGTWPDNITGQNNCYADRDISGLLSDEAAAALYSDNCGGTVTVNHSDENTLTDNCGWTITRTYTISDACGNETTNTMSVSGSDQSAPTLTGTWPSNITGQNNCFANADLSGLISDDDVAALYGGCSGTVTVTHADVNTLTDNCGWTITRTYTINNACGTNSTTNTQSVSGSDQTAPTLIGTWPANITAQNNCFANADVSDLMSDDDVAELYSDGCGGTISVTHTDANTTTDNCGWTITRTYTISDACGNEATNTQSVSGSDETAPTIGDDNLNRQLTSTNCTFIVPDLTGEVRNIASDNCTANGNLTIVQSITAGTEITTATSVIVTVTDQCGNNSTKEIELTLPIALTTSLSADPATIACNGGTTSITNTPNGGTAPYQYFWSNSTNEQNLASISAGTYTVTVRDNNGCSVVESLEITQPNALTASLSAGTISCHGETVNVTNTVAGGTTSYTYAWEGGETSQNLEGVGGGTYSVTVTDANNCIATATITINEPAELTSSLSAGTIGCNGGTANITNTVTGGTEPITYEWSNGSNTQGLTGVVAGEYTVTVRDNNGCSVVQSATISQPAALTVSLSTGAIACNGETTTISANVDGGTSPYTYAWNNDATTESITGAVAGTYSVTVTDANTCATSTAITITQPDALSVSISGPTSVCENTTTTLTANVQGGTTDYTYLWSYNNSTTVSITTPQLTTATEYSVTVTDANECSASASVNVEIGDTPGITIADVTAICVGGNAILQANVSNAGSDYEVVWSSSDTGAGLPDVLNTDAITVTPTTAGTYTYTASLTATSCSDGQPFTSSEDVTLTVNALPDVAISNNTNETTITCSITTISLTATGGTSYQWSNGGTTAENNITSAGNYIVTVTDANGCSSTESITIDEDVTAPAVSINNTTGTTLLTCTTSSINVEATGDDATYLWSNEVNTAANAITTGGTYTVTATADNGCTSTTAIEITPNADAPALSITNNTGETELTCALTSISVTATGSGTSYQWTGGANTDEASNTFTEPGTYTVVATAGNGCSASEQITITRNIEAPDIVASATASAICQGESTTISATGGQSYTWSPETGLPTTVGASITASPTSTITYTVTGVGANGCNGTADVTITVNLPTSSEFTAAACDLYTWNGTNYTESGDFQQTFPNANGCDSVVTLHLTINHAVTNEFSETACSSFEWNSTTYTESGDYVQTLQTVNGCDSVVTLHLTINTPTESNDTVTVCDSYEWNGTTYTETGNYQVTLPNANANGCDSIANLFLTINHAVTGIDRQEACELFTWIDGVTYTESTDSTAAPTFTLQNTEGCDSVVSLYLVVNHSTTNEVSAQMCSGVPYTYEGETFTEAGTYTVTLTNSHGCDSIVTLTITYANNCGGIVSGVVTDENTGDVISNARVTVGNQVTRTNAEGQFSLEVLRGRKALRVSAAGYISYGNMVDIQSDTVFNISLNAPHIETDVDSLTVSSYPYLEQSDSITLINTGSGTLVWSSITEYDNLALVEDSVIHQRRNTRSLWDSIQTFATRENAEQAIATDGFFIYTSSWMRPGEFNRYTPNGEYVETFYIENVGSIRNLSYDGTHFYGTEGTNIIFKLDLDNQTLVDSIETDIQEIRHCSFNKQDGSLLAGSWNSLYRIDIENGTSEQIRNDLANVYSSAFDNLSPGGPYLWLFSQTSQNNGPSAYIRQFNISTGEYTDRTHYLDDINLSSTSLAGGICASEYVCEGKFVLLADVQNPTGSNTIATYEIGRTNNVVRTGKKSGSIAPNSSENISVKASATETGNYSATIKYRAAVMGAYSRDIDVNISAVAPECDAVQQISIVTDTFHTITLDWQPVELGNYESVSYLVFNTASQFAIDTVSGTTVTYDGLSVGEHCFCVMALSQAGYTCLSAASDTVCAEIEPIPCNVALTVEAANDGESIFLTWNKSVGVEYFRIHRDDNAIDEVLYDDSFVDTNVVPEVTYCYTVIAYFEGGICDEVVGTACTKIVSGVCAESPVLQIEAVGYSVHLNWTVTSDSYTYKIFRNDVAIGMTTDTTYFDNVNPGYNYCYKVESLCEYGMFTYSNEECVFIEVISEDENGQGSGDGDAIDEWTADNLTLYPNPTYGQFFIEGQRIAIVQIFNASGMLVAEIENNEDERITINCDSWNPGLYNIRIISAEGETATRRVTIFR